MTVDQPLRPLPLSRVWTSGKVLAEDLTGDDLSDVLELHADASAWWVLPRGNDYAVTELQEVANSLDLDHLAIADLLAEDRRAKFEVVGQARIVIGNVVNLDRESIMLTVHPVSIVATERALICLAPQTSQFHPSRLLMDNEAALAEGGVEFALHVLIMAVINTYEYALQFMEDVADELAAVLFEERPLGKVEQVTAFRLRTALSQLRRLIDPIRTVITNLVEDPAAGQKGKKARSTSLTRRWTAIAEQAMRLANAIDALQETLTSVFDTSRALADARGNQIIKTLTGWAAIIAVPTLVTSFLGMNVGFPLYGRVSGFWVYLVIMVVAAFALYLIFRRKDWI